MSYPDRMFGVVPSVNVSYRTVPLSLYLKKENNTKHKNKSEDWWQQGIGVVKEQKNTFNILWVTVTVVVLCTVE